MKKKYFLLQIFFCFLFMYRRDSSLNVCYCYPLERILESRTPWNYIVGIIKKFKKLSYVYRATLEMCINTLSVYFAMQQYCSKPMGFLMCRKT
jgi:hypothetical protein